MPPNRTGQPPHRDVVAVQLTLREALETAQRRFVPDSVLAAMAEERPEDPAGLTALLNDLDVHTPIDLLTLLQLLTVSSSYTAVSWTRGIALSEGDRVTADDVLRTSWAHAAWEEPAPPTPPAFPVSDRAPGGGAAKGGSSPARPRRPGRTARG